MSMQSLAEFHARAAADRTERFARVAAAFAQSSAIILTDRTGRTELAILSGCPSKPGKHRVTYFLPDGPHGHVTRDTVEECIQNVADHIPAHVRPATQTETDAWMSTPEFIAGAARVAGVQAANEVSESARTQPRVDRALPEPDDLWRSKHSEVVVRVASRGESGVRYYITASGGETVPWETPLATFLEHYERVTVRYLNAIEAPEDLAGDHTAGWYYSVPGGEWTGSFDSKTEAEHYAATGGGAR